MTLDDYLSKHGAARLLATKTGISAPEISRLRYGKKKMSFYSAALIEYGSEGNVKMESLLKEEKDLAVLAFIRSSSA